MYWPYAIHCLLHPHQWWSESSCSCCAQCRPLCQRCSRGLNSVHWDDETTAHCLIGHLQIYNRHFSRHNEIKNDQLLFYPIITFTVLNFWVDHRKLLFVILLQFFKSIKITWATWLRHGQSMALFRPGNQIHLQCSDHKWSALKRLCFCVWVRDRISGVN